MASQNQKMSAQGQELIQRIAEQAQLKEVFSTITSECWDKCMSTPGKKMSSGEESCLANCSVAYMESMQLCTQKLMEKLQSQSQGNF